MKIVAVVPVKLNNERLPGKNTKRFSDGTPLISCILKTLCGVGEIDEIYVYCSNPAIREYFPNGRIRFLRRSESLDRPTTRINEILRAFAAEVGADIYVHAQATSPFIGGERFSEGIKAVEGGAYDSALAVRPIRDFLWRGQDPINYDPASVPRTQDLEPVYEETSGMYVYTPGLILDAGRRVGFNPLLVEVSEVEATDIDEPEDFEIADAIHARTAAGPAGGARAAAGGRDASPRVQVLDCTLRDGGYVNDWRFGRSCIMQVVGKLCESGVDYIECGYLRQDGRAAPSDGAGGERSVFRSIGEAESILPEISDGTRVAIMANCGECDPALLPECTDGRWIIRVAFHKPQAEDAKALCTALMEKGYSVFLQPMATLSYGDGELLSLVEWANGAGVDAFYIVDSFGTMRRGDAVRAFRLVDGSLAEGIRIGFHSHNNLQLSFSNAQELMAEQTGRELIIDSSVLGMGRGAGNLCTELLAQYLNENGGAAYDLVPILEIMDEHVLPIYESSPWGYSAPYYIAAINGCHPSYATYLASRQTLCIMDINTILRRIPEGARQAYSEELAVRLYMEYQAHAVDDSAALSMLAEACFGREVLILAPGRSLAARRREVESHMASASPVVFAVNFVPEGYAFDMVFVSNLKRFKGIGDAVGRLGKRLVCTSNISRGGGMWVLNYASYLNEDEAVSDNAGLMLINALRRAGVKRVALAGFDGFGAGGAGDYCDGRMALNKQYESRERMNGAMREYFERQSRVMEFTFVTPSIFDPKDKIDVISL